MRWPSRVASSGSSAHHPATMPPCHRASHRATTPPRHHATIPHTRAHARASPATRPSLHTTASRHRLPSPSTAHAHRSLSGTGGPPERWLDTAVVVVLNLRTGASSVASSPGLEFPSSFVGDWVEDGQVLTLTVPLPLPLTLPLTLTLGRGEPGANSNPNPNPHPYPNPNAGRDGGRCHRSADGL